MRTNFEGENQSARHISGGPRGGGGEDSGGDGGGGEGSGLSGVGGRSENREFGTFLTIFFVSADTCTVGENGGGSGRGGKGGGAGANGGGLGMGGQAKFASRQLIGHEYTRSSTSSLVSRPQPPRIQSCPRQSLHLQPA